MSRIDAAWKRASGELVEEPATARSNVPDRGAAEERTSARRGGERTRNVSEFLPVGPATASGRAPQPMPPGKRPAVPASFAGKLVGTPELDALSVEQYKRLAAALHELQVERGLKSLMISSALPREGKTLTITNLALTLGGAYGRRVLVVDADLHRPSIHEMFGIGNERGLSDALRSSDSPLAAIQVSAGVSVVPAGRPESSSAVLSSGRLRPLIVEASMHYDWVLLDSPPVAMLTDAQVIARAVDGVLFVIAAGVTPYPLVQRSLRELGIDRVVGTVLNRVDERVLPVRTHYNQHYADRI
jgi:protein-tyrosine kinase